MHIKNPSVKITKSEPIWLLPWQVHDVKFFPRGGNCFASSSLEEKIRSAYGIILML